MLKPLGMMTWSHLIGKIGVEAWLARYPASIQLDRLAALDYDTDEDFYIENTKRLCGASGSMEHEPYLNTCAYLCSLHQSLVQLLQYLEKQDTPENRGKGIPLIYQLHDEWRSPVRICGAQWVDKLRRDGDCRWLVRTFCAQEGRTDQAFQRQASLCMVLALHLAGNLSYRVVDLLNVYPAVAWKALARKKACPPGQELPRAELTKVARPAYDLRPCCSSPSCGQKLQRLAYSPASFYEGELAESLDEAAPHMSWLTADLERLQKLTKYVVPQGATTPFTLDNMSVAAANKLWVNLHKERGGDIDLDITSDKLVEAGANTRRKRLHDLEEAKAAGDKKEVSPKFLAWNMYFREAMRERAESFPKGDLPPAGKRARSATTQKRLENQGHGPHVKEAREELTEAWHSDPALQFRWVVKAEAVIAERTLRRPAVSALQLRQKRVKREKLQDEQTLWAAGSHECPCRPEVLMDAVNKHHPGVDKSTFPDDTALQRGIIAVGEHLRQQECEEFFITDPRKQGWLPQLYRQPLCHEATPGFCKAADIHYWPAVNRITTALNSLFSWHKRFDTIGKLVQLVSVDVVTGDPRIAEATISEVRYARPVQQQVIPVVDCGDHESLAVFGDGTFHAISSYAWVTALMKEFSGDDPFSLDAIGRVRLSMCSCKFHPGQDIFEFAVEKGSADSELELLRVQDVVVWPEKLDIKRRSRKNETPEQKELAMADPVLKGLAAAKPFLNAQKDEFRKLRKLLQGPGKKRGGKGAGGGLAGLDGGWGAGGGRGGGGGPGRGRGRGRGAGAGGGRHDGDNGDADGGDERSNSEGGEVADLSDNASQESGQDNLPGDETASESAYNEWEERPGKGHSKGRSGASRGVDSDGNAAPGPDAPRPAAPRPDGHMDEGRPDRFHASYLGMDIREHWVGGLYLGLTAHCTRHPYRLPCRTTLSFDDGLLADEEAKTLKKLKLWLLHGFGIDSADDDGRRKHVYDNKARGFSVLTDDILRHIPDGLLSDAELRALR